MFENEVSHCLLFFGVVGFSVADIKQDPFVLEFSDWGCTLGPAEETEKTEPPWEETPLAFQCLPPSQ